MSNPNAKTYDCVESMRQIRDRLSSEIASLSHDNLAQWLRSHEYTEPFLQRLAAKAAQQAAASDEASRQH